MKYLYKVFNLLILVLLCSDSLFSQYLDDNGEVLNEKIIEELKEYPDGSAEQRSLADSLITDIQIEINRHPVLQYNTELRMEGFSTLHHLKTRLGDFTFLRRSPGPTWEELRKLDTISKEALEIESQIALLNDSLYALYDQLIEITQRGEGETRATKEKAAMLIGKSPFHDHLEYIFENHRNLAFGLVMDRFGNLDIDFGGYRSGMTGLTSHLTYPEKRFYSWRVMPFLLEYWGDPDWTADLNPGFEIAFFINLTIGYNKRPLLLEFMRANARDPDTSVYERLSELSLR